MSQVRCYRVYDHITDCYSLYDFEMLPELFYKLSNPTITFYDLPGGPCKSIIMELGEPLKMGAKSSN